MAIATTARGMDTKKQSAELKHASRRQMIITTILTATTIVGLTKLTPTEITTTTKATTTIIIERATTTIINHQANRAIQLHMH
jgi:hypothetical protein